MAYHQKSYSYRPESRQHKALPYQPSRERFITFVSNTDKAVQKEVTETFTPPPLQQNHMSLDA